MRESSKYYLKQGKLELSMLDYDEDNGTEENNDLEMEYIKTYKGKNKVVPVPKLKVSKEVYETLHAMGQFLTDKGESYTEQEIKKVSISEKKQKLQKIANSIKVQDVQLPPVLSKEEIMKKPNIKTYNSDQRTVEFMPMQEVKEVTQCESKLNKLDEPVGEVTKVERLKDKNEILNQEEIDYVVRDFFKDRIASHSTYYDLEGLKRYIEDKISAIQNYK